MKTFLSCLGLMLLYTKPAMSEPSQETLNSCLNALPKEQVVLVVSPHPDDDVISMGGTLNKLVKRGNTVHVTYVVTGTNAVRESFPLFKKHKADLENTSLPQDQQIEEAKARVREDEARAAATRLGVRPENLHYLRCAYYKRKGEPLPSSDHACLQKLITDVKPDFIYFAAEDDPHGTHGLASQLLAQVISSNPVFHHIQVVGYRGAWEEWPLESLENLTITTFDQELMSLKVKAIQDHGSQLNALFPGNDDREFYQRAQDRNRETGQKIQTLLGDPSPHLAYAEVFYHFKLDEFLKGYL